MKKLFLLLAILPLSIYAQNISDPDLQSLVNAEIAFANMAKEKNTRDAFITFLTDSAVTFGEQPRKGKKHLEKQKPDQGWLYWEPVYTDISASGDFGFNTGPWEFRQNRNEKDAVAYGRFSTVWRKENGQWKALIDIGISHAKPDRKDSLTTSSIQLKNVPAASKSIMQKVIAEEQKFIREFSLKKNAAYSTMLSDEAIVYRHQFQPFRGREIIGAKVPVATAYKFVDGEISSAGDLAYVYGKALIESRESGVTKNIDANYMRVWKKEDGKNWKIVLDVLTYL
jgi:ketosteroid isomerase-like protein